MCSEKKAKKALKKKSWILAVLDALLKVWLEIVSIFIFVSVCLCVGVVGVRVMR